MHTRRLAVLLLGAWLAGGAFMAAVAMGSFGSVDRLLADPSMEASEYIKVLGDASARTLLRYLASEQNRSYFGMWELVQFGLGAALLVTMLSLTEGKKLLVSGVAVLLLMVAVEHFLLTPYLNVWGRAIDFVPPEAPSPERYRFRQFHTAYAWLEVVKALIILGLSTRLIALRSRRRTKSRQKIDAIHDTDNG